MTVWNVTTRSTPGDRDRLKESHESEMKPFFLSVSAFLNEIASVCVCVCVCVRARACKHVSMHAVKHLCVAGNGTIDDILLCLQSMVAVDGHCYWVLTWS